MALNNKELLDLCNPFPKENFSIYLNTLKKSASILLIFSFVFTPLFKIQGQEAVLIIPLDPVTTETTTPLNADTAPSDSSLVPMVPDTLEKTLDFAPTENSSEVLATPLPDTEPESTIPEQNPQLPESSMLESEEGYEGPIEPKSNEVNQRLAKADEHTGAATTNIPIVVPPGRNGMQPNLNISYSSQNQEDGSIFGYGWNINIPYIERINKMGTEKLYSTTSPLFFSSSIDGELATTTASSTYASRVDTGDMRSYIFSNNQWTVTDKNGTTYKFGYSSSTQQTSSSSTVNIYKWMLEEVRDTNDNFIRYSYFKDNGQIYPDTIYYTGTGSQDGIFKVEFLRESRTDTFPSYKTGFEVKTLNRISQIKTYINNILVRKYDLTYIAGNNGVRSLLNSVQESGYSEGSSTPQTLPTTLYSYQTTDEGFTTDVSRSLPVDSSINFEWGDKLADVNGDGLIDYLSRWAMSPFSSNKVFLQKPDGTWSTSTTYTVPFVFYYTTTNSFHYNNLLIHDINGDGKIDLVDESGSVYLNNGSNWVLDSTWQVPVYLADPYPPHLDDVNGDGLVDIIAKNNTAVFLNLGNTWDVNTSTIYSAASTTEFFGDVNNDTLADSLTLTGNLKISLGNGLGTWLNTTSSPTTTLPGLTIPIDIDGDNITDLFESSIDSSVHNRDAYQGTGQSWNRKTNWIQTDVNLRYNTRASVDRASDLNADGLPDFLSGVNIKINQNKKADLLTKITYPYGGFSAITYKPSTKYSTSNVLDNPTLPIIVYTANKIETNDGNSTSSSETYTYKGGNYYYNSPYDRKFAGFEQIVKTDATGNITKTFYHTASSTDSSHGEYMDNYWKIGKPYRVEMYDNSNNLLQKIINKWETTTTSQAAGFVKLTQRVNYSYDGSGNHKDKAEAYTYNNSTGNLTQKVEYGEVSASDDGTFSDVGTDEFTTTYTYATSSTTSTVSLLATQSTVDHASTKVNESKFYFDSLTLGQTSKGNLTKKEYWQSGSTYIDTEKTYNSYGLITTEKDPLDKTTTYSYDSYNLYPTNIINPLSHVQSMAYDYSSGKIASTTDPNGNRFENIYDGFDRLLTKKQPDPAATSTLVNVVSVQYTDTRNAFSVKHANYLDSVITVDTFSYLDGLGRIIQERKEATSTNFIVKDLVYNNVGLIQKESLPYFSSGSATTTATSTGALFTSYTYDTLGRVLSVGTNIGTTTYNYLPWQKVQTDSRGKIKKYHSDAYGNLVQVDELLDPRSEPPAPVELNSTALLTDGNIVSYYRMEGNSNDTKGSYNGSDSSMSYNSSYGKFGQGASFNGSNSRINISSIFNGKTTFWIHGWVNVQSVPAENTDKSLWGSSSWSGSGNFVSWIRGAGSGLFKFKFDLYGDGAGEIYTTSNFEGNTWYMVDFSVDTTNKVRKIYINGVEEATITGSSSVTLSQTTSYLGFQGAHNNYINGYMDDVAVFNRIPSGSDLSSLYNSSATTTPIYMTQYSYNYLGNLLSLTDTASSTRNFTYDGLGRRLTAQDLHYPSDGTYGSYTYTYDDAGNLTQKIDPKSQTVNYTYDDLNRQLTEDYTGQAGTEVVYTYDTCTQGKSRLCTASSSAVSTSNVYNALGQLVISTSTISSIYYVTTNTYDRLGNKLTITNPDNSQVKYVYNNSGLVSKVQRKESTDGAFIDVVSQINYGPTEQATELFFANGAITTNTYDPNKLYRLTHKLTTLPPSEESMMFNSEESSSSEVILEETPITTPEYSTSTSSSTLSSLNQKPGILDKIFGFVKKFFSSTQKFIADLFTVKTAYAAAPELYSTSLFSDSNLVAYYRMENTNDSKNSYNLTAVSSPSSITGKFNNGYSYSGGNYHYTNSNLGINGGTVTISAWLKINSNPSWGAMWYIASQFNSSSSVEYDIWYENSAGTYKLYVNRGKSGVSDNYISISQNLADGAFHHVALTYDGSVLRGYLDGSLFGSLSTSGNGSGGSVNDFVLGCAYNKTSCGNISWDDVAVFNRALSGQEVANLYAGSDSAIQDLSYTYDSNGNITQIEDLSNTNTAKNTIYTYDELNRLSTASSSAAVYGGNYSYSYTYDGISNMLSRVENGSTTTYTYATSTAAYLNPHAVATTTAGSAYAYTYDNNGNLLTQRIGTSTPAASYTWDYNNQLTQAVGNSATSTYSYDPWGQRVKMTVATTSSATIYYPSKFYNITGSTPTKHLFLPDGTMVATVVGTGSTTTVSYIHTDHLGGTNVVTSDAGDVVQLLDYYPYGSKRLSEGTDVSQREFIGEMYDESSGLSYLNARYYNGANGKFTSQDPTFLAVGDAGQIKQLTGQRLQEYLTDPQAFNSYSYARNNPLRYTDASGLWFEEALSWINARTGIGQAVDNSATYNYMVEHPGQGGVIVGLGAGLTLTGASYLLSAGYTGIGISGSTATTLTTTGGTACAVGCEKAVRTLNNTQSLMSSAQRSGIISTIENQKLQNIFSKLYQTSDSLPGGTAGAIKYTAETGKLVQGSNHIQKGYDSLRGLQNLLQNSNLSNSDRNIAQTLTNQLSEALSKVK